MTITRANVETVLVRRCGKLLTAAELDGTTINGANADLNDPIGWALRQLGFTVASIAFVKDSDLTSIDDDNIDQLLDLAELRALNNVAGNLDGYAITVGPRTEQRQQLAEQVSKRIERLQQTIEKQHGIGLGTFTAGVIGLDFAEVEEE